MRLSIRQRLRVAYENPEKSDIYSLLNDLVGEVLKGRNWRNRRLLDTRPTDVGCRRVHDALPLYGRMPACISGR